MIPPRSLNGENSGNAVRYRIAACRKRLRTNRTSPRSRINIQLDDELSQIDSPSALQANGYSLTTIGTADFEWPDQEEADST